MSATYDEPGVAASEGEEPSDNLVARYADGFPHQKVHRVWEGFIKYAKAAYKDNEEDFRDALRDLCGPAKEVAESADKVTKDKKFAGPLFVSDFLKIVSFYVRRNPKAAIKAAKGPETKPLADATALLSDRSAFETGERDQDALCIAEAICRNHGYVRSGWDRYRWLPTFKYVKGEVRLDPDCEGDIKAARWGFEEAEIPLAEILDDEEIPRALRDELRAKKDAHRRSRFLREGSLSLADADRDHASGQDWDSAPEMEKVVVYRIFSLIGACPGASSYGDDKAVTDEPTVGDKPQDPDVLPGFERVQQKSSMHTYLRAPPEVPDDAAPAAASFDPLEHGRRVYILMVAGFNKILKVMPWPMDHFDRDELPWVECRPISIPGLLHGMNIYRMIRPYMRVINDAIEFWVASERRGAKRVILADDTIPSTELDKLENDEMYAVLRVPGVAMNGIVVKEFAGRLTSFKDMIPFFMKMHDDTTGINEAVSGRAPQVEETASAAKMRQDQAVAALSYIENAVDAYHERKTRMRVAALQRYVPRATEYAPCEHCGGTGVMGMDATGMPVPCMECRGTGRGRLIKKGADFWLPAKHAEAWRDDLSLEEIRGEVIVGVETGSSRTDYAERQTALLTTFIDRWAPIYIQFGLAAELQALIEKHKDALGISNGDALAPTLEALQQAIAAQQEAMAAAGQKPAAGKSPEEIQAAIQKMQHDATMTERTAALEERKAAADVEIRQAQVQAQFAQVQAQVTAAQIQADVQRENAQLSAQVAASPKPVEPPPVDPNKMAELDLKAVECDRKYELEKRRSDAESSAVESDADAKSSFAEAMSAAGVLADTLGQTSERLAQVADTLATKLPEPPKTMADPLAAEVMGTLQRIEAALASDKELVRDEFGRVVGFRVVAKDAAPPADGLV